jgi:hypothetical protein
VCVIGGGGKIEWQGKCCSERVNDNETSDLII